MMNDFERELMGRVPQAEAAAFFIGIRKHGWAKQRQMAKTASAEKYSRAQQVFRELLDGKMPEGKAGHFKMFEQLVILDYQSEDDFVIELRTKGEGDRVILAKTQPQETLEATVRAVQKRAANPEPTQPREGDVLKVPKFNFDLTRRYAELEGKKLLVKNPKVAADLMVLSALQNVRFQFDEKGVRLRSESHIAIGCSASPPPPPTRHIMVFDKPFLVILERNDADLPYFALWVGSPELLVKVQN
jgi:hypothetical protein